MLYVCSHLEDVHFAFSQVAPVALLEAFLGKAGKVHTVQGADLIAQALEDAADDAVLSGVDLYAKLAVVVGVDELKFIGSGYTVVEFHTCQDLCLVFLSEGCVKDHLVDFLLVV